MTPAASSLRQAGPDFLEMWLFAMSLLPFCSSVRFGITGPLWPGPLWLYASELDNTLQLNLYKYAWVNWMLFLLVTIIEEFVQTSK